MAAQTALAESRDPQVLEFARMMIRDHAETSRALREAATAAGLESLPMALNNDQSSFLAALQSLRGRAFDQGYWRQQVLAHRAASVQPRPTRPKAARQQSAGPPLYPRSSRTWR